MGSFKFSSDYDQIGHSNFKRPRTLALSILLFLFVSGIVCEPHASSRKHPVRPHASPRKHQPKDVKKFRGGFHEGITSTEEKIVYDDPRRAKVKDALLHAWTSYEKYAWGHDELQPQTKDGIDNFGGLGVTIVDALDTLYIMGLDEQFRRARQWVATSLNFNKDYDASVFETTIRVVGGLLSAYDLSGDKIFLEKATEIADRLLPAWNSPSGVNYNIINLATGKAHNLASAQGNSILAEIGTEQLEFIALSQRTNDSKYQEKVEKVISVLHRNYPADGLVPVYVDPKTGQPVDSTITFGGLGDSFYEYLLKAWVQGNKTDAVKTYREMWEASMKGLQSLVRRTTPSSYAYICEKNGNVLSDRMGELACYSAGMLALGSSGYEPREGQKILSLAEELARTCYNFYQMTATKLAGESYVFNAGKDMSVNNPVNILRPETAESLFYLWRFTGKKVYQEMGWKIFQAFEKNSRLETGYVGLQDVNTGTKDNLQQSFFPLNQWVFNTEAHPLKIVTRHDKGPNLSKAENVKPDRTGAGKEGPAGHT